MICYTCQRLARPKHLSWREVPTKYCWCVKGSQLKPGIPIPPGMGLMEFVRKVHSGELKQ